MAKPKPGNRRKQPLREQQAKRKALLRTGSTLVLKLLVAGLLLWLLYPLASKLSMPDWLIPKFNTEEKPAPAGEARQYQLDYDFYNLLPQEKVVTPELLRHTDTQRLMVQVASFRTQKSAKKLQQRLNRLGFEPISLDHIKNRKGNWVRVNIGPVSNAALAQRIQKQLQSHGMKHTVIKIAE